MIQGIEAKVNPEKETVSKFNHEQKAPHNIESNDDEYIPFARASIFYFR